MASHHTPPVLEVRGLNFGWPGISLFQHLDWTVPAGLAVVCGEESSGKSTLLRLLAGDTPAHSGSIALCGSALQQGSAQVFRTDPRSDALDASSALTWWASLQGRYPNFNTGQALELACSFGLAPHVDKPTYMLSAGSKRKVWLCAAFAAGTRLTLIDEPYAALDLGSIRFLQDLLHEASRHVDRGWVLADHNPPADLVLSAKLVLPTIEFRY